MSSCDLEENESEKHLVTVLVWSALNSTSVTPFFLRTAAFFAESESARSRTDMWRLPLLSLHGLSTIHAPAWVVGIGNSHAAGYSTAMGNFLFFFKLKEKRSRKTGNLITERTLSNPCSAVPPDSTGSSRVFVLMPHWKLKWWTSTTSRFSVFLSLFPSMSKGNSPVLQASSIVSTLGWCTDNVFQCLVMLPLCKILFRLAILPSLCALKLCTSGLKIPIHTK